MVGTSGWIGPLDEAVLASRWYELLLGRELLLGTLIRLALGLLILALRLLLLLFLACLIKLL